MTDPTLTGVAFADPQFDGQFVRLLDTIPYGGADFGEAFITAKLIGDDRDAWFVQWQALGDRIMADAEKSLAAGHAVSAREGFLRATTYYRTSGIFHLAPPLDDRLIASYRNQKNAFRRASALMDETFTSVTIPVDGQELDAYFATPAGDGPFPTVILVGGYDGTMEETYFAGGAAALRRGYAILLMDGPGQGGALIEKGLHFRPDWETVVTAEVDWLLTRPEVDAEKIVALGRSWGGFLAPRAATAEHRLAAVIGDAPQYDVGAGAKFLLPAEYRDQLETGDADTLNAALRAEMAASAELAFTFDRGMLTHGFDTPLEYLRGSAPYTLAGLADRISCPVLLATGENDPRNRSAQQLYDALPSPKEYIRFTNAEGAGEHDEAGAAALFSQRAFDWLDETLGR
ncbi:alpha/beta fold hydrolase [Microbacterium aoyamense]|uniref:Alpha/beta fold hydrolase n=1 Tax=Microbacterium aoyamense TaxID=344166 RepID=A0ABN2PRA3_9MICO|nr:alpha/beta fold hydrolase [Microbacterium aoyamense]